MLRVKKHLRDLVLRELTKIGGIVSDDYIMILCPWHLDTHPSLRVSLVSPGLFCCFACQEGRGSWNKLATKLNLQRYVSGDEEEEEAPRMLPLEAGEIIPPTVSPCEGIGVVSEDAWSWKEWGYRDIRPDILMSPKSYVHKTFKPSVVRLWLGRKGKFRQERYARLCLHYGSHSVFARLCSEQEIKYFNSAGLNLKDPSLCPFGLSSFQLPKKQAGLILVEGPYDLLRTIQNLEDLGIKESFTVIALLGVSHWASFFKKLELRLLPQLEDTPLIFFFDNDKAGKDLTQRAITDCRTKLLMPKTRLLEVKYQNQVKDPGCFDKKVFRQALLDLGY